MSDFPHLADLTDEEQAYLAEVQELASEQGPGQRCPASKPGKVTVTLSGRARIYFDSQEAADRWQRDNSHMGSLRGFVEGFFG